MLYRERDNKENHGRSRHQMITSKLQLSNGKKSDEVVAKLGLITPVIIPCETKETT